MSSSTARGRRLLSAVARRAWPPIGTRRVASPSPSHWSHGFRASATETISARTSSARSPREISPTGSPWRRRSGMSNSSVRGRELGKRDWKSDVACPRSRATTTRTSCTSSGARQGDDDLVEVYVGGLGQHEARPPASGELEHGLRLVPVLERARSRRRALGPRELRGALVLGPEDHDLAHGGGTRALARQGQAAQREPPMGRVGPGPQAESAAQRPRARHGRRRAQLAGSRARAGLPRGAPRPGPACRSAWFSHPPPEVTTPPWAAVSDVPRAKEAAWPWPRRFFCEQVSLSRATCAGVQHGQAQFSAARPGPSIPGKCARARPEPSRRGTPHPRSSGSRTGRRQSGSLPCPTTST